MLQWVYERSVEDADGVRVEFNTPTPYKAGTLRVALNGLNVIEGYTAPGGTLVVLDDPPLIGDMVYFSYTQG